MLKQKSSTGLRHRKTWLQIFQHSLTTGRSVDQNKKKYRQDLTISISLVLKSFMHEKNDFYDK